MIASHFTSSKHFLFLNICFIELYCPRKHAYQYWSWKSKIFGILGHYWSKNSNSDLCKPECVKPLAAFSMCLSTLAFSLPLALLPTPLSSPVFSLWASKSTPSLNPNNRLRFWPTATSQQLPLPRFGKKWVPRYLLCLRANHFHSNQLRLRLNYNLLQLRGDEKGLG